ncbi:protease modulator HflC [Silicimonas algicola]|uniref:Protein HflC n=1 Tax=Silicimonas algicola TaxID=1826607 RepID=A0A316G347_9RHOB|nr:protease modulator HflC [Silicimonas algicola]AZQ66816.1 protease modulator HflC [Silicimonas algicola]PWK55279.1 protease FtsH subunit HflC [Silicimonas algicola]
MNRLTIALAAVVVLLVVALSSVFIVEEREKALILQFGQIKQVKNDPGLGFKIPFIQEVVRYDDRILSLDTPAIEITPSDDRRLVVDAFARYRIGDTDDAVIQFRQAVGLGGLESAEDRLASILIDEIRAVLGAEGVTSNTILSSERAELMNRIRANADAEAAALGLDVVDVRLKQTNLPEQNLAATFDRMRAEREREATDERARGAEAAQRVQAQADRTVVEIVSEATREAEIVRGEADGERNGIFAEAYGADEDFFRFYRSLTAYENALKGSNSTLVITPDSEFFEFLDSAGVSSGVGASDAPAAVETSPEAAPEDEASVPEPQPAPGSGVTLGGN